MSQADGERERETERCSQGNSQQTDRRIWVPGNALHSSAHLDRLHTTRRTDLPESDRAIITSCEQGGERLQSRPHSMNPSKGCMFYLNITFKLGFQEVLWPQHRKLKEKKIKMNMEFKKKFKKIQNRLFLGRISKTESWKALSWILCGSTVGLYKTQTPESNTYFLILIQRRLDSAFPINTPRKV